MPFWPKCRTSRRLLQKPLEKTSLQIEEIDAKITQTIQEQREEN